MNTLNSLHASNAYPFLHNQKNFKQLGKQCVFLINYTHHRLTHTVHRNTHIHVCICACMHRHTHPHILTHHRYRHTHTIHKQTIRCTRTMYISVSAMGQLPSPPAKWNKGWHPTDTSALLQSTNHWHFSSVTEHHPLTLQLCHRALSIDTSALSQSTIHWHFSSVTEHYPLTLQLHYRAPSTDTSALSQSTIHWHFSSVTEHYPLTLQLRYRAPWNRAPWYHLLTLTHFLCLMRRR